MEALRTSSKQLKLFHIENPLSVRLGPAFFRSLPAAPGVYFFYGQAGELLYIGQSSDLRARIGSYRHVTPEKNPKRTLRLVHRLVRIEWQECGTAADAIELEARLLLEHRPPFNRAGVWQGPPWWLKIEVMEGRLVLDLSREEGGTGPHPAGFRYVVGSLVRCLYRAALPSVPLSAYPHGVFNAAVPLGISLSLIEAAEAAEMLRSYAEGMHEPLLAKLEGMSLGATASEQEYWQEELERLRKYAAKMRKIRQSASLQAEAIPALCLMSPAMKRFLSLIACFACCLPACSTTGAKNEKAVVIAAGLKYLKAHSDPRVGKVKIVVEEMDEHYARLGVTPVLPTTDPATMYLHKNATTGVWEGMTLGTGWSPEDFEVLKIPESIQQ